MTNHTTLLRQSLDALLMAQVDVQGALYSGVKASRIAAAVKALQEELAQPAPAVPDAELADAAEALLREVGFGRTVFDITASERLWAALSAVRGRPVMPQPKGCYPEEWGPSTDRRLTCACGNPDPAHWQSAPAAPAVREPLSDEEIALAIFEARVGHSPFKRDGSTSFRIARAIERANGITGDSK